MTNRFEIFSLLRNRALETTWTAIRQTYHYTAYETSGMKVTKGRMNLRQIMGFDRDKD